MSVRRGLAMWAGVAVLAVGAVAVGALAVTVLQARGGAPRRLLAPAAVIVAGLVGAALFLPLALVSVAGLVWWAVRAGRVPSPREARARATAG